MRTTQIVVLFRVQVMISMKNKIKIKSEGIRLEDTRENGENKILF